MCSYCYEYVPHEEIWNDNDGRNVCFDCEYFDTGYTNKDTEGGDIDETTEEIPF